MNTNQPNQLLATYAPKKDVASSGGFELTLSVQYGVASLTLPAIRFGGTYSIKNLSSLEGKYGKWKWGSNVTSMKKKLTSEGAIRCTNTKGSLIIKSKIQIDVTYLVGKTYRTRTYEMAAQKWTYFDR